MPIVNISIPNRDEDFDDFEEDEESCPEGFTVDECCNCITKYGIETCDLDCPFGGPPRCGEDQAKQCRESMKKQEKKRIKDHEKQKKKQTFRIDETLELDPEKDYPFRSSLTRVARCGMCKKSKKVMNLAIECKKGLELKYPLLANEHDCKHYEYESHCIEEIPDDKIHNFIGIEARRPECNQCSHLLLGYCSGLRWHPAGIKDGKCEFFRDKKFTCKHAVPCLQYANGLRNNYCKLDPSKRDQTDNKNLSWKWMCPWAHEKSVETLKCHEPIKGGND